MVSTLKPLWLIDLKKLFLLLALGILLVGCTEYAPSRKEGLSPNPPVSLCTPSRTLIQTSNVEVQLELRVRDYMLNLVKTFSENCTVITSCFADDKGTREFIVNSDGGFMKQCAAAFSDFIFGNGLDPVSAQRQIEVQDANWGFESFLKRGAYGWMQPAPQPSRSDETADYRLTRNIILQVVGDGQLSRSRVFCLASGGYGVVGSGNVK